jgi:ABC-type Fe3+-hydroxamate transport system substrate-binding protein
MGALAVGRVSKIAALATVALLLGGTACGERKEPTGPLVQIYPVTVQGAADRPAVVQSVPHRIVPLGPGPRRILEALGLQRRTVSVNDSLVGLPLVHQIRRARPDLVVASSDSDPLDLARARSATHAAVYVEPDSSIDDVARAIGDIGLLTGRPVAARRVTASIEHTRRRLAARLSGYPLVSTFVDLGDFTTVPSRSLLGDLVAEARGKNVAGASPEQGPFPLRRLARLDPQAYVTTSDAGRTLADLRANAVTKRLRAVRTGRFGIVPTRLVTPGPGIGAALERVARILHPDAFR